jgi:pimeloyl-ACP methyl ester carboxylesterase
MRSAAIGCLFAMSLLCKFVRAGSDEYRVTQVSSTSPEPEVVRTSYQIEKGTQALNRFHVLRVRENSSSHPASPPVMLLSPFGFPAEYWELTSAGTYRDTFAARLALAGYDVWLVDSRLANVAPGGCETGSVDCSAMSGWGVDTAVDDAMFVRELVRREHPSKRPVLGGFSGGSSAALAAVDREPRSFSGLFIWEGTLYTADPAIRARNAAFCQQDEARLASGVFFDASVQGFRTLFTLAGTGPNDPSPIPVFPPGTTNLQALIFALSVPDPTNPLNFTDTFIRLVGNPATSTFTYADRNRVFQLAPLVGNYAPVRFIRDSHCAIAGLDGRFTDGLGAFRGDLLVYAEGQGFGQMMLDTAALMPHAKVTVDYHPEFAESDPYFHVDWVSVALDPLVEWLRRGHCAER